MVTLELTARWRIAAATGLVCMAFALPCAAQGLECPVPHAAPGAGMLRETPVQIAEVGRYLADDHAANRAPDVVADLRKRYPGVSDVELENISSPPIARWPPGSTG